MSRKVAFVTGASRGIGKAVAVHMAKAGFDVAITARTVQEGESREHSPTVKRSDTSPLPGSLESTADLVRKAGREVMVVPADITDYGSLGAAATAVVERWGGVDAVVHVARYIGAGHMDKFLDTPIEQLEKHIQGNVLATLVLNKYIVPSMIKRGGGTIINFTSTAAYASPHAAAGEGGWGLCYGVSKSAIHRVAGILALELKDKNINVFNVDPGFTATERIAQDMAKFGFTVHNAPPADVSGAVVAWLATNPEAKQFNGQNVFAQYFCRERNLLPGWDAKPYLGEHAANYDLSGAILAKLEGTEREQRKNAH